MVDQNKKMSFYIMESLGLTQAQFASRVGITQATVSNYLSGRTPSSAVLQRISKEFRISIEDIMAINAASDLREAAIMTLLALCKTLDAKEIAAINLLTR